MPNLQSTRKNHSSFAIDRTVYVVGGINVHNDKLNSIEQLTIKYGDQGQILSVPKQWRMINLTKKQLKPRTVPLICPIDSETVIIAGGFGNRYLRGGIAWNKVTKDVVAEVPKGKIKFCAYNNS